MQISIYILHAYFLAVKYFWSDGDITRTVVGHVHSQSVASETGFWFLCFVVIRDLPRGLIIGKWARRRLVRYVSMPVSRFQGRVSAGAVQRALTCRTHSWRSNAERTGGTIWCRSGLKRLYFLENVDFVTFLLYSHMIVTWTSFCCISASFIQNVWIREKGIWLLLQTLSNTALGFRQNIRGQRELISQIREFYPRKFLILLLCNFFAHILWKENHPSAQRFRFFMFNCQLNLSEWLWVNFFNHGFSANLP